MNKVRFNSHDDIAKHVIGAAYDSDNKNRRNYLRAIQRVLSLAEERGFQQADGFDDHFRKSEDHNDRQSDRYLKNLFEYVSPEEFSYLAQVRTQENIA